MKRSTTVPDHQAEAQRHVAEPLLAVGFMSSRGRVAAAVSSAVAGKVLYQASPWASWRHGKASAKRNAETHPSWLVAVSDQTVYLMSFTLDGSHATVERVEQAWPRGSFRFAAEAPGRLTQAVHLTFGDGTQLDGEVYRGRAYDDLTVPLLAHLAAAAAA